MKITGIICLFTGWLLLANSTTKQEADTIVIDTIYHENGKIKSYGQLLNGQRVGTWYEFGSNETNEFWKLEYLNDSV